jgi:transposase
MSSSGEPGERSQRRHWSHEHKALIVAESLVPGASAAEVARRHGINANLLFTWRRKLKTVAVSGPGEPMKIIPMMVTADVPPALTEAIPDFAGRMEIVLAGGERIIVGPDVDVVALTRVVKALSRR